MGHHIRTLTALGACLALALTACSSGDSSGGASGDQAGTVSLWHFFSDREADVLQSVVDDFEASHPGVTVDVHPGQDDEKLRKAIAAGSDVDVAISYSTDIVGNFCQSGAFQDLGPFIQRDGVDLDALPDQVRAYTEFDGVRCAMPLLADAYGLYYNKTLLADAGIAEPPKTLEDLQADALALTTYNPDGSIKTLGFNPWMGWQENAPAHLAPAVGATWFDDQGAANISGDPAWAEIIDWQKAFVDQIGVDKLQKFSAASADEFSADNDFQTGRVAMVMDGEWRVAFIDDQAPDIDYGTAPFPVAADHQDLYGGGYITGNIAGIAKGTKNVDLAWSLLKYLTTDTGAVTKLADGLKNVPTTTDALTATDLHGNAHFATFLDIATDPHTLTTPPSANGAGYQLAFADWWAGYQAGDAVSDLTPLLTDVDDQIDAAATLNDVP